MKKLIIGICLIPLLSIGQTTNEVFIELKKQDVKFPEIVLAQSLLETGWYQCKGCSMDVNNLFGLYNSKKKSYFPYDNWKESIGGYKRGVQYKYFKKEYKDYYQFLNEIGYASDPEYTIKLKKLVEKIKKSI
jgi:flagellum-specific peptidoglycan hydrolase FlgJ